ncbi:hypothetical protein PQ465_20705 [Sphingobacterium oryzagri]|uniref:PD-(D/E)XK nuclease superfamily protein n=1 Tax=Sphingobacterium oryzagri TaxID=3025669 RepID=A0ABY7WGF3_9SPHI|nr:PD-(D/E)XK nuclease family protein [Sphingobacterium sp. KACC 22765]WDF68703.1 hypothetical protein PQ465_20705 [Sphingobacterium sp. KACC 22765]
MTKTMQPLRRPNIFKISNKELSQDAFITWLLQWANPACNELDSLLHQCGKDFLALVIQCAPEKLELIKHVKAGRQWEHIDVWAEISFTDGTQTFLIIEDKVFGNQHSNQLERYKKKAHDYCCKNGFELACAYFKVGNEPLREVEYIMEIGFKIINRMQIKSCLQPYRDAEHSILTDYVEYINELEDEYLEFEILPPKDWVKLAWVGFYQFVESNLKIVTWHRVNNPSGGFWNLCLTWEYWNDSIPVYMQIEQSRLCYKIALGENETGLNQSATDINSIQDYVFNSLMSYAKSQGETSIRRPNQLVHRGSYRTLAVIDLENWCGDPCKLIDKQVVLANLSNIIAFYRNFMDYINRVSFEAAEIRIKEH